MLLPLFTHLLPAACSARSGACLRTCRLRYQIKHPSLSLCVGGPTSHACRRPCCPLVPRSLLRKVGCLHENMARQYIAQTVLALEYCHTQGIIHRDMKVRGAVVSGNLC